MFSWITRMIKGLIIALGFILPGVSGGVLAAILGIYERMISFLAHIKDNFKEKSSFSFGWYRYDSWNCSLFSSS